MKKVIVALLLISSLLALGILFIRYKNILTNIQSNEKTLTISNIKLTVEIAKSSEERRKGLSGRKSIANNQGMLFIFEKGSWANFWMKDMLIPIDIIWISDGKVVQINKDIKPPNPETRDQDLTLFPSLQPIDFVLEVSAGFSDKNNIKIGDSVEIPQAL